MFSSVLFLTFCRDGLSLLVVPFALVKFIVSESAFPSPFVRGILARKSRRKCRLPLPSSRDGAARFQFNFAKGRSMGKKEDEVGCTSACGEKMGEEKERRAISCVSRTQGNTRKGRNVFIFFPQFFFKKNLTTACTSREKGTLSSPVSAYSWPYKSALVKWIPRSYIRIVVHRIWQLRNNAAKTKKNKK